MIPALILVLLGVLDGLVPGAHSLHWTALEYVVVKGFVGLCAGLLLEVLLFGVADVGEQVHCWARVGVGWLIFIIQVY